VAGIAARADEVVERELEWHGELLETIAMGADKGRRRDPRGLRREDVLQRIVVGSTEKADFFTGRAASTRGDIGSDELIAVAEVRRGVDVGNCDGQVRGCHRDLLGQTTGRP
jgi:hypothetical protein